MQSRSPSLRSSGRNARLWDNPLPKARNPAWLRLNCAFHINGQSDSSLKRIIPELHVPSRGSQARGTRLWIMALTNFACLRVRMDKCTRLDSCQVPVYIAAVLIRSNMMYINFHLIISIHNTLQIFFNRVLGQKNLDIYPTISG
jgi:hypothetical protein